MLKSMHHILKNLRSVFESAAPGQREAGMLWYKVAQGIALDYATHFKVPQPKVCRIIAALSPQCSWERNLVRVREYLETGHSPGLPPAWKGAKVQAFAASIFYGGESTAVCVDRHMINAALTKPADERILKKIFDSPGRIKRIQRAVAYIAGENKIWPAQAQAIIWVVQRGKREAETAGRNSVQQVRKPVRGIRKVSDTRRGARRGAQARVEQQRVDGGPLSRLCRTERAQRQGKTGQAGKEKENHPRRQKRGRAQVVPGRSRRR